MAAQIPAFREKHNYTSYSLLTLEELFGDEALNAAGHHQADIFESVYLENEGGKKFNVIKLPLDAQVAPIQGMLVNDFDLDGNLDLLVHGNFFEITPQYERQDGMKGLFLKFHKKGKIEVQKALKSGFYSPNDSRGLDLLSQSATGRPVELVVANKTGLRAYSANRSPAVFHPKTDDQFAILHFKNGAKQKHEFRYGEGYLTQNSRDLLYAGHLVEKIKVVNSTGKSRTIPLNLVSNVN